MRDIETSTYIEDSCIDLYKLHHESRDNARLFTKWGKRWVKASTEKRDQDEVVKTVRSELILDYTENWKDYGLQKPPTGQQVEAFYRTHERYIKEKKELVKLKGEVDDLYVAMRGMEIKESGLDRLQRLLHDEYWSVRSEGMREELEDALEDGRDFSGD